MSEHIEINGKNYLPGNALAGKFGYTSDYISKLAREEKILGIQVDRQWYIEPNSLEVYLHHVATDKEIKKDALRATRKKERALHGEKSSESLEASYGALSLVQTAQALAILMCGIFSGYLGWLGYSEHITPASLAAGAGDTVDFIAQTLRAPYEELEYKDIQQLTRQGGVPDPWTLQQATVAGVPDLNAGSPALERGVYTELPLRDPNIEDTDDTDEPESVVLTFSDVVRVVVDETGRQYLEPVLKGKVASTSSAYSLTAIDVTPGNN